MARRADGRPGAAALFLEDEDEWGLTALLQVRCLRASCTMERATARFVQEGSAARQIRQPPRPEQASPEHKWGGAGGDAAAACTLLRHHQHHGRSAWRMLRVCPIAGERV